MDRAFLRVSEVRGFGYRVDPREVQVLHHEAGPRPGNSAGRAGPRHALVQRRSTATARRGRGAR